jgi:YHS domain-containing protein
LSRREESEIIKVVGAECEGKIFYFCSEGYKMTAASSGAF